MKARFSSLLLIGALLRTSRLVPCFVICPSRRFSSLWVGHRPMGTQNPVNEDERDRNIAPTIRLKPGNLSAFIDFVSRVGPLRASKRPAFSAGPYLGSPT
jgi:hypothetical protein